MDGVGQNMRVVNSFGANFNDWGWGAMVVAKEGQEGRMRL